MKLPISLFDGALKAAARLRSDVEERTDLTRPGETCTEEALGSLSDLVDAAAKTLSDLESARKQGLGGLLDRLKAEFEDAALDDYMRQALSEAATAGIESAAQLAERKLGAVKALLEVIANLDDAALSAVMGILMLRIRGHLLEMRRGLVETKNAFQTIAAAASALSEIREGPTGIPVSDDERTVLRQAARIVLQAEHDAAVAYVAYKEDRSVRRRPLTQSANHADEAAASLSGGRAFPRGIPGAIEDLKALKHLVSRGLEEAGNLPGYMNASSEAYKEALRWVEIARLLPQTIGALRSMARLGQIGQRLDRFRSDLARIRDELENPPPTALEVADLRRAKAEELRTISRHIRLILPFATEVIEKDADWYLRARSILNDEIFSSGIQDLRTVELYVRLVSAETKSEKNLIKAAARALSGMDPTLMSIQRVGRVSQNIVDMEITSRQGNAAIAALKTLMKRAGIENGFEKLVSGELPETLRVVLDGIEALREPKSPCFEIRHLHVALADEAEIAYKDKLRTDLFLTMDAFDALQDAEFIQDTDRFSLGAVLDQAR